LLTLDTAIIANIAGRDVDEFTQMARRLNEYAGQLAGLELNISCPNVTGGVDFGTDPRRTADVVGQVVKACDLPVIAKLTPNVTDIASIAAAAADAGADAVSLVNTFLGMSIDWRKRRPRLGKTMGGLSGPAIKPLALRCVYQVAQAVEVPIIGVGGIANIDDVMEFLVAGATAVQIGTANFYSPGLASRLVSDLDRLVEEQNCAHVSDFVGTLQTAETTQPTCRPS
jgi:dihydroorotate dehydrogenase (NAD+) catalytic subunit